MRTMALAALLLVATPPVLAATLEVRGPQDGGFTAQVVSVKEARFTTTQRQKYDFSCGSAALATLLPPAEPPALVSLLPSGSGCGSR